MLLKLELTSINKKQQVYWKSEYTSYFVSARYFIYIKSLTPRHTDK
jgi:hypothetical protein